MRFFLALITVSFLSCSGGSNCSPENCFGCCSADGVCAACPEDGGKGGGTAGGAAGGAAAGVGGGAAGGAAGGTAGGTAGGHAGGAGGGSAGGHAGGSAGGTTGPCTSGNSCTLADAGYGTCCGGVCKSTLTDLDNCSGCGVKCAVGSSCAAGKCTTSCDGGTCPSGTQCTTSQYSNLACYPDTCSGLAQNSFCARNDPYSGRCCGAACLDTMNDTNNCGYCGNRCSAGQDCFWGSCYTKSNCATEAPASGACRSDAGYGQCCGGQCVTLATQTDRENCGGCGLHCPVGDVCINSQCARPDGGYTAGCINDPATQCASGTSCNQSQTKCVTSSCTPSTFGSPCSGSGNSICCGTGQCIDIYSDSNNCAACGKRCGAGQFCDYGQCKTTPTCGLPNSGVDCPLSAGGVGWCCGSQCVSKAQNDQNCGACGAACPSGETCQQGQCRLPDAGYVSSCGVGCPAGTTCDGNRCLPVRCAPGSTGEVCGFGVGVGSNAYTYVTGKCCNGTCVDFMQDSANCSACGTSCPSGLCVAGSPYGGFGGSMCYAPASTNCTFSCPMDTYCAGGRCVPRTCQSGPFGGTCQTGLGASGMCCSQGFSSVCVNPTNDPANCGGCGISCGTGGTCNNGVCSTQVAPCTSGHLGQFCDLDAGTSHVCCPGGGCVDMKTDGRNCGRCGNVCGSGLTCVEGACLALTCSGQTSAVACADDAGTTGNCCSGSCVHRSTDPLNCGTCGRICVGSESCTSGFCALDVCDQPSQGQTCHRDAGSYVGSGQCCSSACLDTRNDRNNCGGCGRVCPGDAGCVSGNCQ